MNVVIDETGNSGAKMLARKMEVREEASEVDNAKIEVKKVVSQDELVVNWSGSEGIGRRDVGLISRIQFVLRMWVRLSNGPRDAAREKEKERPSIRYKK